MAHHETAVSRSWQQVARRRVPIDKKIEKPRPDLNSAASVLRSAGGDEPKPPATSKGPSRILHFLLSDGVCFTNKKCLFIQQSGSSRRAKGTIAGREEGGEGGDPTQNHSSRLPLLH